MGDIGGFAGLFDAGQLAHYDHPVLATSTDGVGTKVAIAQAMDVTTPSDSTWSGMVVDDLVVCGAEPLFMTDYIACGKVDPERIAAIVKGIADGVREAGCALLGGETAEHPGLLGAGRVRPRGRGDRSRGTGPRSWARSGVVPATCCWPWNPPACTPTDTPWSDAYSAPRAGRWIATFPSSARPSARSC